MRLGEPSSTAMAAAAMRAAHLHLFQGPNIHEDTFALRLLGVEGPEALRLSLQSRGIPALARVSAYFALRHKFSEERMQRALEHGVRQVVLLGAGLDTFALRRPELINEILFVEVDHPASQQWKLDRLETLGLRTPGVTYLAVDFATQDLETELAAVGVDVGVSTFYGWLGVTQYISVEASLNTLAFVARHGAGSEVVFDVIRPLEGLHPDELLISTAARDSSAKWGEPWVSYFVLEELEQRLRELGFTSVTRLTPDLATSYYVGQDAEVTPLSAWMLISARI